jgi:tetratricopeptide (TPR) repeat protein
MRFVLLMMISGLMSVQLRAQGDLPLRLQADEDYTAAPDSSFSILKGAYNKALEKKDPVAAALCLQQMGQICFHLGHYPQSLDYHLQAGDIFRQQGKKELQADNLNDIGLLYYYNKQRPLARHQYEAALAIYSSLQDKGGIAATYGKIGHLYEKQQQYDSAFFYQRQALSQYQQIDNKKGTAKIYENLGSIYEDLASYDSAYYYFDKALLLNDQPAARIEVLNNLGDILRKTGRYQEGIVQTRRALMLALQTNEHHQLSGAYRDIAKAYHLQGMHDSAYIYLELSRRYLLDIYSDENSKQVALLQTVYDIEKKNIEIERLINTRKTTRITTIAIIVVVLLLVVLGLLIISRQRLKIKNERMESLQQRHNMEAVLESKQVQEGKLKEELEVRSRELTTHTLHIIQKNQLLEDLRNRLDELVKDDKRDQKKQLKQLLQQINSNFNHDEYWVEFRNIFEQVHQSFFTNLKKYCDSLTANDLRLVALLKMNLGSTDIAMLLGISQDSLRVVRYRLRKKLNLSQGESLTGFLQSL